MTAPDVIIRPATLRDTSEVVSLWKEFIDFHKVREPFYTRRADGHEQFVKWFTDLLDDDDACIRIAEQSGRIVGYGLARIDSYPPVFITREYGSIYDLAVTASCRRQGIGKALTEEICGWFAERGLSRVELRVALSNEVSTSFWRSMGFVPYISTLYKCID